MLQHPPSATGGLLSVFIYFLVLQYNLMLFPYVSLTVSAHVFLMDPALSSPNPRSLSLFLASLSSPAPLLHQSFSNSLCSAEPQLQTYILKEPKLSHVRKKKPLSLICPALPHSLSLPLFFSPSSPPSVPPHPKCCLFIIIGAF